MENNKKHLIIFIGKPGVGKSTLIESLFAGYKVVDVLPFVMKQKAHSKVPEEKTILGYHDMYKYINSLESSQEIVLELGTNHAELNVNEIDALGKKFILKVFLCDAPKSVCLERVEKRGREFDKEALMMRLERDFPNSHIPLFQDKRIKYSIVDMSVSIQEIQKEVNKIIRL